MIIRDAVTDVNNYDVSSAIGAGFGGGLVNIIKAPVIIATKAVYPTAAETFISGATTGLGELSGKNHAFCQ